jgi:hypothetical protein
MPGYFKWEADNDVSKRQEPTSDAYVRTQNSATKENRIIENDNAIEMQETKYYHT